MTKPNDIFAAVLQMPDVNVFDLINSNITTDNTQLKDKDFYKNTAIVQEKFKTSAGGFDDLAFENAYNQAISLYQEMGKDEQFGKMLLWDPYDYTAPFQSRTVDVRPLVSKDINPTESLYSRTGINSITPGKLSFRELAQKGRIHDITNNTWYDRSGNDLSLWEKFFGDTLVYAQYDKDTDELDPLTGKVVKHLKGEWKYDKDGNLYLEKLGNREIYGKQIVNPLDILTTDESAFNKVDFFDSDGKTKSTIGTSAKLLVEIAPFLIPGVQVPYGTYKMISGLSYILPTFYKAIEGIFLGDTTSGNETAMWKAMNSAQGYLAKYNQHSVSDESSESLFNYEQLANLVSDVYSQIYEQRAAANLSNFFYKQQNNQYVEKLGEVAKEQLGKVGALDYLTGISRSEKSYEKLAQRAAAKIADINPLTKKRSRLAQDLNLTYMALTQSADIYGDALAGGYDRHTAGAAALFAAAGQFAIMRNNIMSTWFLDDVVGYSDESAELTKSLNKAIKEKYGDLQKGVSQLATSKSTGKTTIGNAFKTVKDQFTHYLNGVNTSTTISGNIVRNSLVEGLEEVTEQAVLDMTKGVVDFLSYAGLTPKKGTFGGFDVVFSKSGFENYLANLVGGVIGGGLFEFERSVVTPLLTHQSLSQEAKYNVIEQISNGKTQQLLEILDKESKRFASTTLSPMYSNEDGSVSYLSNDSNMTHAKFIYENLREYIKNVDNILNSEQVNNTDEQWVRKAVIDELRIQDLQKTGTDSFIISDVRELVAQLVDAKNSFKLAEDNKQDTSLFLSKIKDLKTKIDEIQLGEKAEYYYGLANFSLNEKLHQAFVSLNVDDYVKSTYNKEFYTLTKPEQDAYTAEFTSIMNDDTQFKARMKTMYDQFLLFNEKFSKSLQDYGIDGYNVLRKEVFNTFYKDQELIKQAVLTRDINTLKRFWANLHTLNLQLNDKNLPNVELNSSIGVDFGKFLLENNVVSVGLSDKEQADLLNIKEENLQNHLPAQALLTRLEKQGIDFNQTLEELNNNLVNLPILEEEKKLLQESILKDYDLSKTLQEVYKPEVFKDIDFNSLSEEEKLDLQTTVGREVNMTETTEEDVFENIITNINKSRHLEMQMLQQHLQTLDPNDLENITRFTNLLTVATNRKNLRVHTSKTFLNQKAAVIGHLHLFYKEFFDVLIKTDANVVGLDQNNIPTVRHILDVIDELRTQGLNDQEILMTVSQGLQISGFSDFWNDLINLFNEETAVNFYTENKEYSDIVRIVVKIMEKIQQMNTTSLDTTNPIDIVAQEVVNSIGTVNLDQTTFNQILFHLSLNITVKTPDGDMVMPLINYLLNTLELESTTQKQLVNEGVFYNNIIGGYFTNLYQLNNDPIYHNPTVTLLIDFIEDAIGKGEKLDYELIEAAKSELAKLKNIDALDSYKFTDELISRLEKAILYGNTQHNSFLDKLREIEFTIYNGGVLSKSIFTLLKDLNTEFTQYVSPTSYKINRNVLDLLDRSLGTLSMVRGIITAMTTTADVMDQATWVSNENLYGFNANLNRYYKKNKIAKEVGMLLSEDINQLSREIEILEIKLKHFKLLAENNLGSIIEEQGQIQKAIISAKLKRFLDQQDSLSLINLKINGVPLLTIDDIRETDNLKDEEKVIYLEVKVRQKFAEVIKNNPTESISELLDKLFAPFKDMKLSHKYTLLDNPDSVLTESMTVLESKDWYNELHAILAADSLDFYKIYKKYVEKELTLQNNFRAPFFTQQIVMRQVYGYLNGSVGKQVMQHAVSFIVPEVDSLNKEIDPSKFIEGFIKAIKDANGIPLPSIFFVRGTGGTGKSDVIANWIIWLLTDPNLQILGDKLSITALAPTEKTKVVLEKSISRNLPNIAINTGLVEEFINSLFSTTEWADKIAAIQQFSGDGEVKYLPGVTNSSGSTGVFIADNTAVLSQSELDELFKGFTNTIPKFIVIDEASKINSLQYQILNYLAQKHNYYLVVLGDDLQEGTIIGPAKSSLENLYTVSSIKLKSTIRAKNPHKNDNNITLENFVDKIRMRQIYEKGEIKPVILKHAIVEGKLSGDKFIDSLTKEDLLTLDPTKEILFITENGTLTDEQKNIIKLAFGDTYLSSIKVSKPDIQGQEFDQVVILSNLLDSNQDVNDIISLNTGKKINTALGRAQFATLIVGQSKFIKDYFIPEVLNNTANKTLTDDEIKGFLTSRNSELEQIISNLDGKIKSSSFTITNTPTNISQPIPIESEAILKEFEELTPIEDNLSQIEAPIETPLQEEEEDFEISESEISPDENTSKGKESYVESKFEEKQEEQKTETSLQTLIVDKDVKVLTYPFYLNLGKDLGRLENREYTDELQRVQEIIDWIEELNENNTDFAGIIFKQAEDFKDVNKSPEDIIKLFYETLDSFIKFRNLLLSKIIDKSNSSNLNSDAFIEIYTLWTGDNSFVDINNNAFIIKQTKDNYANAYKEHHNPTIQTEPKLFLVVEVAGVQITLGALAEENTAISSKNTKGDLDKLKDIYLKLKTHPGNKVPISLKGNIQFFSGVETLIPNQRIEIVPTKESLEERFAGTTVKEFGAFRGPRYNEDTTLDEDTVLSFMAELEDLLNQYNTTRVKVVDRSKYSDEDWKQAKSSENIVAYQQYMFRPYIILSYVENDTQYSKLVLLYPKKRSAYEMWTTLEQLYDQHENKQIADEQFSLLRHSSINRFQAWNLIGQFVASRPIDQIEDTIDFLWNAFIWQSYLSHNIIPSQNVSNLFRDEMKKWDPNSESFSNFISNNLVLQRIFRNITKSFNPILYLQGYKRNMNPADQDSLKAFEEFLANTKVEDFPIYYNLKIYSKHLDGAIGVTIGNIDESILSQYMMVYNIQMPKFLLNLEGIDNTNTITQIVPNIPSQNIPINSTPTTPIISTNPITPNNSFKIALTDNYKFPWTHNSTILEIDLNTTNFSNLINIIQNNPTQKSLLTNFLLESVNKLFENDLIFFFDQDLQFEGSPSDWSSGRLEIEQKILNKLAELNILYENATEFTLNSPNTQSNCKLLN